MSEHRVTDAAQAAALVTRLEEQGVRTVMIGGVDTPGMMRGKRFPIAQLPRLLQDGMVLCNVFWVIPLDESDLVVRPAGHSGYFPTEQNGYPDIIGIPDLQTARTVPWHADTAFLLCDWELPHGGGPVPIAPRNALKSVLAKAAEAGEGVALAVVAGVIVALLVPPVRGIAERTRDIRRRRGLGVVLPLSGLVIGLIAAAATVAGGDSQDVLFSGQTSIPALLATTSAGSVVLITLAKAFAYAVSLGSGFRGGPVFPSIFLGTSVAVAIGTLNHMSPTVALAIGAACGMAAFTRLIVTSSILALLLTGLPGVGAAPCAVLGAVAAWVVSLTIERRRNPKPSGTAT